MNLPDLSVELITENGALRLGTVAHTRFLDRVEQRRGRWGIVDRTAVYDFSSFTFPLGPIDIEQDAVTRHRVEYAALAYLLKHSGFPVGAGFTVRGSSRERELKNSAVTWLRRVRHTVPTVDADERRLWHFFELEDRERAAAASPAAAGRQHRVSPNQQVVAVDDEQIPLSKLP